MRNEPLRVAWGPFAAASAPAGYGVIAGWLAKSLAAAGADVLDMARFGWDVAVAIGLPHAWPFTHSRARRDLCWHTMFEMDRLPDGWANVLNHCGLAWAPSQHSAELFRAAGVTAPIGVSGYGVDPTFFHPHGRPTHDKLRFLAWGPELYGRKNLLLAAQAFLRADLPPDACELEIKLNAFAHVPPHFQDADTGRPIENIRLVTGDWQASEVADWLRTGDVLIYLSGGEGFGLQPLEAMACGVTVICADNTGMREYLRTDVALPVECRTQVVSPNYSGRFRGGPFYQWQPSEEQAIAHIRWCFAHQAEVQHIGAAAAEYVARDWTWTQAGVKALALLQEHFA